MTNLKQVIIVRKDLNMRKGKMIAQGSHASLMAALDAQANQPTRFKEWMEDGQTKIAVSVDSEKELHEIYRQAKSAKLPCSLITDAGKTEFGGIPTKTAAAIGPAEVGAVDAITSLLKLL